ncbi:MAG: complement resistance protein TraT [Alphaproteobacteria bacterium]|jgi:hypothetical protein|nr:complement resistance protein TraT [Alphaproteobacteria bacterium]
MNLFKRYAVLGIAVLGLASCSAIGAGVSSNELETSTKVSRTIWLDPIADADKVIYVNVRNTSDNADFNDLERFVRANLMSKGFLLTNDPKAATYVFQVNVRQAVLRDNKGRDSLSESAIQGAAIGGLTSSATGGSNSNSAMATGILAGAALGLLADSSYEDSTYYVNADFRIVENKVNRSHTSSMSMSAHKINISLPEAVMTIKQKFAQSLSGMF